MFSDFCKTQQQHLKTLGKRFQVVTIFILAIPSQIHLLINLLYKTGPLLLHVDFYDVDVTFGFLKLLLKLVRKIS